MKNFIIPAALLAVAISCNAETKTNYEDFDQIVFNFHSECVCDRYDDSEGDTDRYVIVYHNPYQGFEYEEIVADGELYREWCSAACEGRIFHVNVIWKKETGRYQMDERTYVTYEPDGEIMYPEM